MLLPLFPRKPRRRLLQPLFYRNSQDICNFLIVRVASPAMVGNVHRHESIGDR